MMVAADDGVSTLVDTVRAGADRNETGLAWLQRFKQEHGRALRVLHLGNIANNAYLNGKIQRERGIEADVACWDYYHVMGCPEWEDAEFEGDFGDPFRPDWWAVDLNGFERPHWFVQGPLRACQLYLMARRRGRRLGTALLWRLAAFGYWRSCRSSAPARFLRRHHVRVSALSARAASLVYVILLTPIWTCEARCPGVARFADKHVAPSPSDVIARAVGRARWLLRRLAGLPASALTGFSPSVRETTVAPSAEDLIGRFSSLFPDRPPLTHEDYESYKSVLTWRNVFEHYDIVQAYATNTVIPLLCGFSHYTGYEHGTLRQFPLDDDAVGRFCALGYHEAEAVFVTNMDVLPTTRRIGLDPERLVFLPHAVDSERLRRFGDTHAYLTPPPGEVTFLSPTRQDWVDGNPSLSKRNDHMIRALALVRDRRLRFRVLIAEWGRDLEMSKRLISELDLDEYVTWIPALRKRELWEAYLKHHAVLDQFAVPGIGGVAFEALGLGRRVITRLDVPMAERFFGAAPPLLPCSEPEEIADAMADVINDPLDRAGIGAGAQAWFDRFHSADRIVDLQARAYRQLLGRN